MKQSNRSKSAEQEVSGATSIAAYSRRVPPEFRSICEHLRASIDKALPDATSKVWHGGPVWFLDGNPVVGYSATAKSVNLLFWNGRALDEPDLRPVGKYGAAQAVFRDESEIDAKALLRWLRKAKTEVLDSKAFFAKKRARK